MSVSHLCKTAKMFRRSEKRAKKKDYGAISVEKVSLTTQFAIPKFIRNATADLFVET